MFLPLFGELALKGYIHEINDLFLVNKTLLYHKNLLKQSLIINKQEKFKEPIVDISKGI